MKKFLDFLIVSSSKQSLTEPTSVIMVFFLINGINFLVIGSIKLTGVHKKIISLSWILKSIFSLDSSID